jgi:hypothetical protein
MARGALTGGVIARILASLDGVRGPDKILMGPLNLVDLYGPTDRMRKLEGFSALTSERLAAAKQGI